MEKFETFETISDWLAKYPAENTNEKILNIINKKALADQKKQATKDKKELEKLKKEVELKQKRIKELEDGTAPKVVKVKKPKKEKTEPKKPRQPRKK